MYLNKAFIIGNLTRDPEMKALPSGVAVTSFSVATNRRYKAANGSWEEATDYHNIVVFGRQAENCNQYLKKGSNVLVEGRIQTRSWEQNGEKKYRTEIVADRVQFGPRQGGSSASQERPQKEGDLDQTSKDEGFDTIEYPEDDINPEDIPF